MTCRQTEASVWRGPATIGEIPALQIQASMPPHSATAASATASLKSSSVTSPLSTRDVPGRAAATAFRSRSVRATSATEAPARENAWESKAPRPRLAPVMTTRFPETLPGLGERRLVCRSGSVIASSRCTDQYSTRLMAARPSAHSSLPMVDLVEMQRRMLLIRGFEERVAALYRDGEVPGFVHLSTGQEAAAVGACWPLGPADVITSTHRGHGHCLAKGLDPAGDVRRADGQGPGHEPRPRRLHAHRRPEARDLRRQRHRRRRRADCGRGGDGGPAARATAA